MALRPTNSLSLCNFSSAVLYFAKSKESYKAMWVWAFSKICLYGNEKHTKVKCKIFAMVYSTRRLQWPDENKRVNDSSRKNDKHIHVSVIALTDNLYYLRLGTAGLQLFVIFVFWYTTYMNKWIEFYGYCKS